MLLYAIFFALYEKAMCNIPPPCAPWGAQGGILRMAALIKGRLSDNRPEAFAASFQTEITLNISTLSCA